MLMRTSFCLVALASATLRGTRGLPIGFFVCRRLRLLLLLTARDRSGLASRQRLDRTLLRSRWCSFVVVGGMVLAPLFKVWRCGFTIVVGFW